jgi:hypothetical protein
MSDETITFLVLAATVAVFIWVVCRSPSSP